MGDVILNRAAEVTPPRSGVVQQVSVTSTGAATALDTDFPGKWVSIYCISGAAFFLFGDANTTVDATATSGATLGKYITAGEERQYKLESTDTHISCDSTSTATLEIVKSGK